MKYYRFSKYLKLLDRTLFTLYPIHHKIAQVRRLESKVSMKVSLRVNGRVTSIVIKDSILALYCTVTAEGLPEKKIRDYIYDAIAGTVNNWHGDTAKGLSSFVTDKLINDMLSSEDLPLYRSTLELLTNEG